MSNEKDFVEEIPSRELPLSTVDNTPPLMLDLPDGQQLVVGKLPDGIVIEIATWRGTGRPDSRTNRMMLGVSYDEDDDGDESPKRAILNRIKRGPESTTAPQEASGDLTQQSADAQTIPVLNSPAEVESILQTVAEIVLPMKNVTNENSSEFLDSFAPISEAVSPEIEDVVSVIPEAETPELEQVQEEAISTLVEEEVPVFGLSGPVDTRRNMQDLMGARSRAQLEEETRKPLIERGHEIVRRPTKKRKEFKINYQKLIKPVGAIALSTLGVFLLLGPAGIKFTLPEGGLRTSMSAAANALVIVRESDNYQIGDSVVAAVDAPSNPDYFASIAAQSDVEYVLTENNLYHTALRENVKGRVVLVMPGIGFLLHKLGL